MHNGSANLKDFILRGAIVLQLIIEGEDELSEM